MPTRYWIAAVLPVASCFVPAAAVELGVSAGISDTAASGSYSWQMEYRQRLAEDYGLSFQYLNEGHLPGHHRDGGALEAWADAPPWRNRFRFSFGAGPYLYCDTRAAESSAGFRDNHGVGAVVTASLTWYWQTNWFTRASLSQIRAPGDIDTTMLVIGLGYREDASFEPEGASEPPPDRAAPGMRNELGALFGQTVVNSYSSPKSQSFGLEYRRGLGQHLELSGTWLDEGDTEDRRRHSGLMSELWLAHSFLQGIASVGIGAGPYVALGGYRVDGDGKGARVAGMGSITTSWHLHGPLVARLEWHRALTHDNQDRDIVTAGLAWSWGE